MGCRFREVPLPSGVSGRLYLHAMPGRYEEFREALAHARQLGIDRAVRLTPLEEVASKSPDYARAIAEGDLPWRDDPLEVPDYSVPEDSEAWIAKVVDIARALRAGERVLVHCGAGIGRTGTFAICVLMALGLDRESARQLVETAGSGPEVEEQWELVDLMAQRLLPET